MRSGWSAERSEAGRLAREPAPHTGCPLYLRALRGLQGVEQSDFNAANNGHPVWRPGDEGTCRRPAPTPHCRVNQDVRDLPSNASHDAAEGLVAALAGLLRLQLDPLARSEGRERHTAACRAERGLPMFGREHWLGGSNHRGIRCRSGESGGPIWTAAPAPAARPPRGDVTQIWQPIEPPVRFGKQWQAVLELYSIRASKG